MVPTYLGAQSQVETLLRLSSVRPYEPESCPVYALTQSWTVNDILAWSSTVPPNDTYYEYATVGMTYISLRNDSLRLNSSDNFAPPFVYTTNITNWAWVEDPSLSASHDLLVYCLDLLTPTG